MKNVVLKILLLASVLCITLSTSVMAASGLVSQVEAKPTSASTGIINGGNKVAGIVAAVGVSVALVILIWLGIKYIIASPSDKADIKKSAVAYIIGAVVLFAASGILALIASFATELGDSL